MENSPPQSRSWLNLATAIEQTLLTNFEPNFSDIEWQEVIKALRAAASESWVPVTDRLPDDDALVYLPRSKTFHIAFVADDGNWYDPNSGEDTVFAKPDSPNGPSHWMPLPEAPKVSQDDKRCLQCGALVGAIWGQCTRDGCPHFFVASADRANIEASTDKAVQAGAKEQQRLRPGHQSASSSALPPVGATPRTDAKEEEIEVALEHPKADRTVAVAMWRNFASQLEIERNSYALAAQKAVEKNIALSASLSTVAATYYGPWQAVPAGTLDCNGAELCRVWRDGERPLGCMECRYLTKEEALGVAEVLNRSVARSDRGAA